MSLEQRMARRYFLDTNDLKNIPPNLWDEELCMTALRVDGLNLRYLMQEDCPTRVGRTMYVTAVMQNGLALEYVPVSARKLDVCLYAVINNPEALPFVPKYLRGYAKDADMFFKNVMKFCYADLLEAMDKHPERVFSGQGLEHALYSAARLCGRLTFDYEAYLPAVCVEISKYLRDFGYSWALDNKNAEGDHLVTLFSEDKSEEDPNARLLLKQDVANLCIYHAFIPYIARNTLRFRLDDAATADFARKGLVLCCLAEKSRELKDELSADTLRDHLDEIQSMSNDELVDAVRELSDKYKAEEDDEHRIDDVYFGFELRRTETNDMALSLWLMCKQDDEELLSARTEPLVFLNADMSPAEVGELVAKRMSSLANDGEYSSDEEAFSPEMSM